MTDRHVAGAALAASLVVVVAVGLGGGGLGPVALAAVGTLLLSVAVVTGAPPMVVLGAMAQMGAVAWASGAATATWWAVVAAPAVWVAAEAGWRSLDLRPRVRARGGAATSWAGVVVGVSVAVAGLTLVLANLGDVAPEGGLTFRVLGIVAVVGVAGLISATVGRRLTAP